MSQRGRKRAKRASSDDEEDGNDEEAVSSVIKRPARRRKKAADAGEDGSQAGEDNKAKRWEALSREQREKLVGDVMRLALFLDHKKHPLKRADITSKVLVEYKGAQITAQVIAEAQKRFKDIFGYELVEVPRVKTDAADVGAKGGTGVYILKNIFPKETKAVLTSGVKDQGLANQTVLLHTILTMITLSEGVLDSELLHASLKKLGLDEDKPDPVLGDWKKLIDYFVKEMYIHRQKVPGRVSANGGPVSEYRWGARAQLEVDKIGIMRHVAAMFGEALDPLIIQEMEKAYQQRMNQKSATAAAVSNSQDQEEPSSQTAAPARRGRPRR